MLFLVNQLLERDNRTILIVGTIVTLLLIVGIVFFFIFQSKKKKSRKLLNVLRVKIQSLKQTDAIKNYSMYDNLKNDEKLGMLVIRWKKSIELLVREIDAQYSMIDVLDDSIASNKFKNFYSLFQQVKEDFSGLEQRSEELNDEIAEYINKASDNRKYISKYQEMFDDLVEQFQSSEEEYANVKHNMVKILNAIDMDFNTCQNEIKQSNFESADAIASSIFEQIKRLDLFLEEIPKFNKMVSTKIEPKYKQVEELREQFSESEIMLIDPAFINSFGDQGVLKATIINNIQNLHIENTLNNIIKLENYLDQHLDLLTNELKSKHFIINNISYQKEYLTKIENTAKNFISVFKMVCNTYSENDIKNIEEIIVEIEETKVLIDECDRRFNEKDTSFDSLKTQLKKTYESLTKISKYLDENIRVIDEIYSDEKVAREKIAAMTEKINGTKKFIKYASLGSKERDLEIINQLNLKLTDIYILLSEFPVDIVKLNELIDDMINKVEKTTKNINNDLYKALLTEYSILYANRYYRQKEYRNDILAAENYFYSQDMNQSYDRIMTLIEKIDPQIKRVIVEKYQLKFNALFS